MHRRARQTKTPGRGRPVGGHGRRTIKQELDQAIRPTNLPSLHGPELKVIDTQSSGYVAGVTYAGAITYLCRPAQGTGQSQRIGDVIRIRGIQWKINGYPQGSSTFMRAVIFRFNLSTSIGVPSTGSILQSAGATPQVISCPYSYTNAEQGQFTVLYDEVFAATVGVSAFRHNWDAQVDLTTVFDAGGVTGEGQLCLLLLSDAVLAANAPVFQYWSRVFYEDD